MKTTFLSCLTLIGLIFSLAEAGTMIKGIYGDDNRRLISELDGENKKVEEEMARSVLAQIPYWRVNGEDAESLWVNTKSLAAGMNFCPDEKFADLPLVSSCSAFLVGEDLILTAGHCVKDKFECQKNYWALDYEDSSDFVGPIGAAKIKKENIVTCAELVSQSVSPKLDFALIRINKKIKDRAPLEIRRSGKVSEGDSQFVIGHPMGLPKIMADEVSIRNNSLTSTFLTDADTFSGNSGSPVINSRTHTVEGILIRGDIDFEMDLDLGCNRSFHCLKDECKGETVLRTSSLPLKLIPKI